MLDRIKISLADLMADKRGVTAVEYTVIAALIIVAISTAFITLGSDISTELGVIAGYV